MKTYHVVAVSNNGVIGKDNKLPWHFSSDLKHFKKLTSGNTVIMGRKTFEGIGKPLPDRENFVVSKTIDASSNKENLKFFESIDNALREVKTQKAFIIGGAQLFEQTLSKVDGIYLTQINEKYEGDVRYPAIPDSFKEKEKNSITENGTKLDFIYLEKEKT